jgi:hypothetical protein
MLWAGTRPWLRDTSLVLAAATALACLARDGLLLRAFGLGTTPDTASYLLWHSPLRSEPYPLLGWLFAARENPLPLLSFQIATGALAAAVLVLVLSRRSPLLGALVALFFVSDVTWAEANRYLTSEGVSISFVVLSLALFVHQLESRSSLRWFWLVSAGALYAWTMTIRPSNLYLLVPLVIVYLLFTRSWRKTAWLTVGMAAVLAVSGLLTARDTGRFQISGGTGYYLAFPLFSYHLYDPANGPESREAARGLSSCDPAFEASAVVIATANERIWRGAFDCLYGQGWSPARISATMTGAYLEGIRARPASWLHHVFDGAVVGLSYQPSLDAEPPQNTCSGFKWCDDYLANPQSDYSAQSGMAMWETWVHAIGEPVRYLPVVAIRAITAPTWTRYVESSDRTLPLRDVLPTAVLWLVVASVLVWRTRGAARVAGVSCIALLVYTTASVSAGHVFLPRYVAVLSPFVGVISALLVLTAVGMVIDTSRLVRRFAPSDAADLATPTLGSRLGPWGKAGTRWAPIVRQLALALGAAAAGYFLLRLLGLPGELVSTNTSGPGLARLVNLGGSVLLGGLVVLMVRAVRVVGLRLVLVAAVASVSLLVLLPPAVWSPVPERSVVLQGPFKSEGGFAYWVGLPDSVAVGSDTLQNPSRSQLQLYEGSRQLGPAHSLHQSIRDLGAGRYSDWSGTLRFSSSDGSDPNLNGQHYSATLRRPLPGGFAILPAIGLAILILLSGFVRLRWRGRGVGPDDRAGYPELDSAGV